MPSSSVSSRVIIGMSMLGLAVVASGGLTAPAQAITGHWPAPLAPGTRPADAARAAVPRRPTHSPPGTRPASPARAGAAGTRSTARPQVSSVVPAQGAPGWPVTLTGSRFRHITSVSFGGLSATFSVTSTTRITTVVPVGARSGPITVTGRAGSSQSQVFTVTPRQMLEPGETLASGHVLTSKDGHYTLAMRSDGNLAYLVTGTGQALWTSGTAGNPGAYLTMLGNGNLVLYSASGAATLWSTRTSGHGPARLVAQANGNLVVYDGAMRTWASGSLDNKLRPGETMRPGWYLTSGTGYKLIMRQNGNLVETGAAGTIWSSGTAGHPGASVTMQRDGDLVVSDSATLWTSKTAGHPGARLVDQRSGILAVRYRDKILWASASVPTSRLTMGQWAGQTGPAAADKYYRYPYPHPPACTHGGACQADKWEFYRGQCTSWAAFRVSQRDRIAFSNYYGGKGHWGDAVHWASHARALGITVNGTPTAGSVAWYGSTAAARGGHVTFVEKVNSPTSIVISEMNYDGDNGFWVHTITKAGGDWPAAFIHIADH